MITFIGLILPLQLETIHIIASYVVKYFAEFLNISFPMHHFRF